MIHEELREKLLKAMGGKISINARESWGKFLRERATEFRMKYDWIKVQAFYKWMENSKDVDFGEGGEFVCIFIVRHGEVGHASTEL